MPFATRVLIETAHLTMVSCIYVGAVCARLDASLSFEQRRSRDLESRIARRLGRARFNSVATLVLVRMLRAVAARLYLGQRRFRDLESRIAHGLVTAVFISVAILIVVRIQWAVAARLHFHV